MLGRAGCTVPALCASEGTWGKLKHFFDARLNVVEQLALIRRVLEVNTYQEMQSVSCDLWTTANKRDLQQQRQETQERA